MNDRHRFALPAMSLTISALPGALQRRGALQRGQASGPNTLLRAHLFSDDLMWRPLCRCSAPCRRQRTERRNGGQDFLEQTARHHDLAIWKVMDRLWRTIFAPIFSRTRLRPYLMRPSISAAGGELAGSMQR